MTVPVARPRSSAHPWIPAALIFAVFVLTVVARSAAGRGLPAVEVLIVGAFAGWGVLGCLIVGRVPAHAEGWLLAATGAVTVGGLALEAVARANVGPLAEWAAWLEAWVTDSVVPVLVILVILFFPQGRLRTRLERVVLGATVCMGILTALTIALAPGRLPNYAVENPAGVVAFGWVTELLTTVLVDGPLLAVAFLLALTTLALRSRRARGDERQQIKWFVYAVAGVVLTVVLGSLATTLRFESSTFNAVGGILFAIAIVALPVAITVAVLKYRLYDIDLIVNKTIVYLALTAVLAAVYTATIVVLQQLLRPFGSDSDLAVAASTLTVAGMFGPLRTRVQRFIDRRFYRRRYDAQRVVVGFVSELRDEVDLNAVTTKLGHVIHEVIQPVHLSLWTASPPTSRRDSA